MVGCSTIFERSRYQDLPESVPGTGTFRVLLDSDSDCITRLLRHENAGWDLVSDCVTLLLRHDSAGCNMTDSSDEEELKNAVTPLFSTAIQLHALRP